MTIKTVKNNYSHVKYSYNHLWIHYCMHKKIGKLTIATTQLTSVDQVKLLVHQRYIIILIVIFIKKRWDFQQSISIGQWGDTNLSLSEI